MNCLSAKKWEREREKEKRNFKIAIENRNKEFIHQWPNLNIFKWERQLNANSKQKTTNSKLINSFSKMLWVSKVSLMFIVESLIKTVKKNFSVSLHSSLFFFLSHYDYKWCLMILVDIQFLDPETIKTAKKNFNYFEM